MTHQQWVVHQESTRHKTGSEKINTTHTTWMLIRQVGDFLPPPADSPPNCEKPHSTLPFFFHVNLPLCFLQLTDFGLARFYSSTTRTSDKDSGSTCGTLNYMPPEAFTLSYKPASASDIYRWCSAERVAWVEVASALLEYSKLNVINALLLPKKSLCTPLVCVSLAVTAYFYGPLSQEKCLIKVSSLLLVFSVWHLC